MSRHKMRIVLSVLLSLALLGWPSTLLATRKLNLAEKRLLRAYKKSLAALASNSKLSPTQQIFGALGYDFYLGYYGYFPYSDDLDRTKDLASTTESADRSILGIAPGALVPIPGGVSSCCCAAGVVVDPLGLFVLTTNSAQNRVCVHRSDPETSALTPVPGSPFSTGGTSAERLAMDPAGEFLFVANSVSNNVSVFSLDLDTGALALVPGSPFAAGSQPLDVTMDGFGRFLYVANNLSNSISAFSINRSSGALTPVAGSPFGMGSFLSSVEADPLGRFLYAMDGQRVFVLSIGATGALTPAAGSPLSMNPGPSALAADPSGQFLLVTQTTRFIGQSDTVSSYRVNASGSLALVGSPVALGEGVSPSGVAVDPGGSLAYVSNQFGSSTAGFSLNPNTGALTPIPGSPFPSWC